MSSSLELPEIVIDNGDRVIRTLKGSFYCRGIRIIDPNGTFLHRLNKIFLLSCVLALAWDPLFFYVPVMDDNKKCLILDENLAIIAGVLRTFTDLFYLLHIILQFHTGFITSSTRVFGEPEIVQDHGVIARRYLSSYFIVDILAVLPFPQMAVYVVIPKWNGGHFTSESLLISVIFCQYVPRITRIYPLYKEVKRTSGLITDSIWAGAVYNLFLYMLASHVVGSIWYLFAIDKQSECWDKACLEQGCNQLSLYCKDIDGLNYTFNTSYCTLVDPGQITDSTAFNSGLYYDVLRSQMVYSTQILRKLSYCFWWGLRNLSSCGQNLETSTYFGENVFATFICVGGLILFALLIGNMQKYLQMLLSADSQEKEARHSWQVTEQWMSRRLLPEDMRERIRRYELYKWKKTRGVNEESIMLDLPRQIRMDIKRYLGLDLVMRGPLFRIMNDQLKETMCDRLKPMLYTKDSFIVRKGDPVNEMLFGMKGKLLTITTNRMFNSAEDFCGEELLTWAINPHSFSDLLPISTRTVLSETEVKAFALLPDDLRLVASHISRLHSKEVKHTLRFYSQQWRTRAACSIQMAWQKYNKRKSNKTLQEAEENTTLEAEENTTLAKEEKRSASFGAAIYALRFKNNVLRSLKLRKNNAYARKPQHSSLLQNLQKPAQPDFTSKDD